MKRITKIFSLLTTLIVGSLLLFTGPAGAAERDSVTILACGGKNVIGDGIIRDGAGRGIGTVYLVGQTCRYDPRETTYFRWASALVPKITTGWRALVQLARSDGRTEHCWISAIGDDRCETPALAHVSPGPGYTYHAGATIQHYVNGRWVNYATGGTGWK